MSEKYGLDTGRQSIPTGDDGRRGGGRVGKAVGSEAGHHPSDIAARLGAIERRIARCSRRPSSHELALMYIADPQAEHTHPQAKHTGRLIRIETLVTDIARMLGG